MKKLVFIAFVSLMLAVACFSTDLAPDQESGSQAVSDERVQQVLDRHRGSWGGMNVPEADGQALYDIILEHGYKNALEIGTSNGYSGMWIAWALSKTGGKLITVEIDRSRYEEALRYFSEAGLDPYIDARLGNAHDIVPALPGPFDFVFCDADKEWYNNYLESVLPKLTVGGCFAAHNVADYSSGWRGRGRGRFGRGSSGGFLEFARGFSNLETEVLRIPGSGGMSVSYKKSE